MRGTKKHTRQQIQDELDRLKTRLRPAPAGVNTTRFGFETPRENLPAAMVCWRKFCVGRRTRKTNSISRNSSLFG